jgi:transposase
VDGYEELVRWLSSFGELAVVGVESSGCYAAGLVRYLRSQGVRVLEVNEPHAHARRRLGKSDPIDAELAARVALAGKADADPQADRRDRRVDPPAARGARARSRPAAPPWCS